MRDQIRRRPPRCLLQKALCLQICGFGAGVIHGNRDHVGSCTSGIGIHHRQRRYAGRLHRGAGHRASETLEKASSSARDDGRIVQAGHLERFNPAVTAARQHLHQPMFFESHRLSVFTPRSLDVDVVLDLMIHDLDIVLSLVASPVREVRAVGLPVLSNKVDIANVRLEFENGCVANFTASRVSTERVRKLRFFQPHQYLSLDFARQDLLMIDVTAAAGMDPAQLAALVEKVSQHPSAGLSLKKIAVEQGEPLRLEVASFLGAVRTRGTPVVSGEDGRAALALGLEINRAIAAHAERTGL